MNNKSPIERIKEAVSVPKLLYDMGFWNGSGNRIACPLHGGENGNNFEFGEQIWTCHSECATSGDVINFIEHYYKMSCKEALRFLDTQYELGIFKPITHTKQVMNQKKKREFKEKIKKEAPEIFTETLNPETLKIFKKSRTENWNNVEKYGEGFLENRYLLDRGISLKVQNWFDVFYTHNSLYWEVNFPLRLGDGTYLGDCFRYIDNPNLRYVYPKDVKKPLYGEFEINKLLKRKGWKSVEEIWVVEGFIDCLTLWSWGKCAVALGGVSANGLINELLNLPTKTLILALDNDEAGWNGTRKIIELISPKNKDKTIKILNWGNRTEKDINDLTKEKFNEMCRNNIEKLIKREK